MGNSFKKPGIAVIRLHGVIVAKQANTPGQSKVNFETARPLIDKAFKTKNLKAVLLSINSPGGSPVQVAQLNFTQIIDLINMLQNPLLTVRAHIQLSPGVGGGEKGSRLCLRRGCREEVQ